MVRLIRITVAINRNNIREFSLCKWLICLTEMYLVVIYIFAIVEISRIFLTKNERLFHWYIIAFIIIIKETTHALSCSYMITVTISYFYVPGTVLTVPCAAVL